LNAQYVSPARAPSIPMMVAKDPSRRSRSEHELALGAQMPSIAAGWVGPLAVLVSELGIGDTAAFAGVRSSGCWEVRTTLSSAEPIDSALPAEAVLDSG
jgi:hypothetical protein